MATILIADDDPITYTIIAKIVNHLGHSTIISPNGRHALDSLRHNAHIDILITDIKMPDMDGRELVQIIREDKDLKGLPIIMVSAIASVSYISHLLDIGITFFQSKPIDRSKLEADINFCLSHNTISKI